MFRLHHTVVIVMLASMAASPAFSQADPALGPLIAPIQPEPRLGLPSQAPDIMPVAQPPAPVVQPRAPAAPAAAPAAQATPSVQLGGEWVSTCVEEADAERRCQAVVRGQLGEQTALVVALARVDDQTLMQVALPLGFSVERPVAIGVASYSADFRVSRCTAQGCLIEGPISAEFIEALQAASSPGTVRMSNIDGTPIELPLPVTGASGALRDAGVSGDAASQ